MDVVEVPFEIAFIFDQMFPEPSLPDAALAAISPRGVAVNVLAMGLNPSPSGETFRFFVC